MTESTSSFGSTTLAPPPSDPGMPNFDEGGDDNRRKLILVGAVVGVVILAVAAYFLLLKGSGSSSPQSGLVAPVTASGGPSTGATPSGGSGAVTLPKVAKNARVHNPFKPLVVLPSSVSTGSSGGSGQTQTSPKASTGSTGVVTSAPSAPVVVTSQPTNTQPSSQPSTSQSASKAPPAPAVPTFLKFDHAKNGKAVFTIFYSNGSNRNYAKTMAVKAPSSSKVDNCHVATAFCGTRFDKQFGLISIFNNGHAVTVQIGDSGYDLKRGQRVGAGG